MTLRGVTLPVSMLTPTILFTKSNARNRGNVDISEVCKVVRQASGLRYIVDGTRSPNYRASLIG